MPNETQKGGNNESFLRNKNISFEIKIFPSNNISYFKEMLLRLFLSQSLFAN